MDWTAIRNAVRDRMGHLGIDTKEALTARCEVSRRTITSLFNDTVTEAMLAKVSRGLDWPYDALERIGRGADPDDMPTVHHDTFEQRLQRLETEVGDIQVMLRQIDAMLRRRLD